MLLYQELGSRHDYAENQIGKFRFQNLIFVQQNSDLTLT